MVRRSGGQVVKCVRMVRCLVGSGCLGGSGG